MLKLLLIFFQIMLWVPVIIMSFNLNNTKFFNTMVVIWAGIAACTLATVGIAIGLML